MTDLRQSSKEGQRLDRVLAAAAALTLAATVAGVLAGLLVYARAWEYHTPIGYGAGLPAILASDVFALSAAVVGLAITIRARRNLVGWLLAAFGLFVAADVLGLVSAACGLARAIEPFTLVGWLSSTALQPGVGLLAGLLMLVYPSGRLLERRCRWVAAIVLAGALLRFIEVGWAQGTLYYFPLRYNTYAPAGAVGELIDASRSVNAGLLVLFGGLILATLCVIRRYRRSGDTERLQLRAFAASSTALAGAATVLMHLFLLSDPFMSVGQPQWVAFFLVASLHPVAIGLAISRYRLYDIDRLISRAFVYGALTAILAGLFTASVTLSQRLFVNVTGDKSDIAIVLTTLIAAASYTPVRRRLEGLADRHLKYDSRRFGAYRAQLRSTLDLLDPETVAQNLAGQVVKEVGAVSARVELETGLGHQVAHAGQPLEAVALTVEIAGHRGPVGRLLVGPRDNGQPYRDDEIRAISEIAGLAGRALELNGPGWMGTPSATRGRRAGKAGRRVATLPTAVRARRPLPSLAAAGSARLGLPAASVMTVRSSARGGTSTPRH